MSRLTTAANVCPGEEDDESMTSAVLNASVVPACKVIGLFGIGGAALGTCWRMQPGSMTSKTTTAAKAIVFILDHCA
jgi:hypothetical protein